MTPASAIDTLRQDVRTAPGALRGVLGVAVVEGVALLAAAGYLAVKTIVDRPDNVGAALGAALMAVLGAVVIVGLGAFVLRRRLWARTPLVVLQLVFVPVGFSVGVQAGRTAYGVPVLVLTLLMLALLALPESREALRRPPPG